MLLTRTTPVMTPQWRRQMPFVALILLALALRLIFVLILDPSPELRGGDAEWYLRNGRALITTGKTPGPLQTGPIYPLFIGAAQVIVPGWPGRDQMALTAEVQLIRVLQAALGAALVGFVVLLARRLLTPRAAWIAGIALALSPALIIESGNLATESLFLALVFGGLLIYTTALTAPRRALRLIALTGLVLGLATLTRAVLLLFPLALVLHLALLRRQTWPRLTAVLLLSYAATVSTWTVYNLVVWDRVVIGGEGILSFVYQGATAKASPQEIDTALEITIASDRGDRLHRLWARVRENILGDPLAWGLHRAKDLGKATLQPHNTQYYPGESIRYAAQDWVRNDRSWARLRALTQIEAFWPKLAIYVFHYGGLLGGLWGMWRLRRAWRSLFVLYALVIYVFGVHLILLALPRYLFPTYPALWMLAAGALAVPLRAPRTITVVSRRAHS